MAGSYKRLCNEEVAAALREADGDEWFASIKARVDAMNGGRTLPQCQVDWTEAEQNFVTRSLIDVSRLLATIPALKLLTDALSRERKTVDALCSRLGITREDAERLVEK